jgi:hypothetical protein
VLERAGLIVRGRDAQFRPCRLSPAPLQQVHDFTLQIRRTWEERLDRLGDYLEELQAKEKRHGTKKRRR